MATTPANLVEMPHFSQPPYIYVFAAVVLIIVAGISFLAGLDPAAVFAFAFITVGITIFIGHGEN
jgi:uncharacterized membrane protein YphA (DoxX/SURF4 family)